MRPAIAAAAACSALCTVLATGLTILPAAAAAPASASTGTTTSTSTGTSAPGDPDAGKALARLRADADKPLTLHSDRSGNLTFVGTRIGDAIDNPAASSHDDAVTVARHDLDRYGDALGLSDGDAGMRTVSHQRSPSGDTVVRLQQTVDDLPVLGGQVVVSVDDDGGTSSILSTTSSVTRTSTARVGRADAAATALSVTARAQHQPASSLHASGGSLAVFDPAAFGATGATGARTVRQFEVGNNTSVREQVLVDAVTGQVLLHVDNVQTALNRKVCDQQNHKKAEVNCTTAPARADAPDASAITGKKDVDSAFELSGEVSAFYQQIGGFDLTNLIGFGPGEKTLGSTVNFCEPADAGTNCPYRNAFWNGNQMFYGHGYAGADDVVGHEMTHGVIAKNSNLFYFFQSGAINESLADTMGEIIDHRYNPDGRDTANSWTIGEDLPGGAIRSMGRPGSFGQPDSMTSSRYVADLTLADNGGVHTNSGVGNKTAYLIMNGGTLNGVHVNSIDAGHPDLTKSAELYLDVIKKLTSGSDYADLGRQLTQSCADLVGNHTPGFTSGDCANVALAVQATALAKQPAVANASTPTDAPVGCPNGQSSRVLFDDESASNPVSEFTAGSLWTRAPGEVNGFPADENATSGKASWFGLDPDPSYGDASSSALTLAHAVTVPAGGRTYMRFNHWYAFDYSPASRRVYFDGGLVKIDNTADSAGGQQASGLPWINGPNRGVFGSSNKKQTGFGGVSNGWVSSRVDLTSYAGKTIKPQFQVIGDGEFMVEGWYLDDIEIYTCGEELPNRPAHVTASGGLRSATLAWTAPRYRGDGIGGYRVSGPGGVTRDLTATATSTRFTGLTPGKSYTFAVRGLNTEEARGAAASVALSGTRFTGPTVARTGSSKTKVTGRLIRGSHGVRGKVVQIQRKTHGTWVRVARRTTDSTGHLTAKLRGRSKARYRLVFSGATGLLGRASSSRHL